MLAVKKPKLRHPQKSKSKRQRTFTSSQYSLPEDRNNASLNQLFRNDLLKRKTQPKPSKSQKQLGATKKRTKSKSKFRLDKCQTYEVIPYKNSLNSEIIFSNEDTKREGHLDDNNSQHIPIRVNQQYLIDNNRQLRISIKKQYQKKVEAAIKIQKVYRGYLTRKILLKHVQQEHKMLSERLAHIRSQTISEHSSFFTDKSQNQSKRRVNSEQQGVFEEYHQPENEEQSQEQIDIAVYRHHQPIYSHEEISGCLSSSQEEDDFDQAAFNNNIIFQCNEEYIDSRKSSGQNQPPKNKLSRAGQSQNINEEPPDTPDNPVHIDTEQLTKTQKKNDRERRKLSRQEQPIKGQTLKLSEQPEPASALQFLEGIEYDATLKQKEPNMKKGQLRSIELEVSSLQKLKQSQMMKWSQIIQLVQKQITAPEKADIGQFMQQIMDMSLKNKELLELQPSELVRTNSQASAHSLNKIDSRNKIKIIRANRQYLQHYHEDEFFSEEVQTEELSPENEHQMREKPKQLLRLPEDSLFEGSKAAVAKVQQQKSDIPITFNSPLSSFENSNQMKKYLSGNLQQQQIEQMLKLRSEVLRKKQLQELEQLNVQLQHNLINQENFIKKIEHITNKYHLQKESIQNTKQDISKGYQAAMKLTKEAFKDAKQLGFYLPVSRSMEGIRFKNPVVLSDVIIDELVQVKRDQHKNKIPIEHPDSDRESSDLEFTEEELSRFRRAQPYDIALAEEIADMGRNVMINEQLFKQQQQSEQQQNVLMKTQHVFREIYQIEESSPPAKADPKIDQVSQKILQWILLEVSGEMLIKPLFSQNLIDKNNFYRPKPVTDAQRLRFIKLLEQHFPQTLQINHKLNQKICPLPTQLLKCMRIDFTDEDEDDNSYEEIGKYEFIIGQDICNQTIKVFMAEHQKQYPQHRPSLDQLDNIKEQYKLNERVVKYIEQRQKYISNRRNHTKELRWEVLNIQVHCIFDAWNQQLIFLRSQKAGYSGIGLNELTLSVKDHNSRVPLPETLKLIDSGKNRLIKNLSQSSPALVFPAVVEQDEDQQLQQDSRWIFYADQALSYGLQLVYLIEEEILGQMAKQLRKRMLQFFP